jgi:hypothetical protein
VVHIGKGILDFLFSLHDVMCAIFCHATQMPLNILIAPCLWPLILVIKGPSKTSKVSANAKKDKMKCSVHRSIELFIQRKTCKMYYCVHSWWLNEPAPPKVKGRRYLHRRHHRVKCNHANHSHITVYNHNQRRRAQLDHDAMQYVAQLKNGVSARRLQYAYVR